MGDNFIPLNAPTGVREIGGTGENATQCPYPKVTSTITIEDSDEDTNENTPRRTDEYADANDLIETHDSSLDKNTIEYTIGDHDSEYSATIGHSRWNNVRTEMPHKQPPSKRRRVDFAHTSGLISNNFMVILKSCIADQRKPNAVTRMKAGIMALLTAGITDIFRWRQLNEQESGNQKLLDIVFQTTEPVAELLWSFDNFCWASIEPHRHEESHDSSAQRHHAAETFSDALFRQVLEVLFEPITSSPPLDETFDKRDYILILEDASSYLSFTNSGENPNHVRFIGTQEGSGLATKLIQLVISLVEQAIDYGKNVDNNHEFDKLVLHSHNFY